MGGRYKRFAYTDSGVSPLAVPGQSNELVVADSDEHDEEGHITEDGRTRTQDGRKEAAQEASLDQGGNGAPLALRRSGPKRSWWDGALPSAS